MRRMGVAVALGAVAALAAGCGGGSAAGLVVAADPSLKTAFVSYGGDFNDTNAKFMIADSGQLAQRIRKGATVDVLASSNLKLLDSLNAQGVIERPTLFASEDDGVSVAVRSPTVAVKVNTLRDLARRGIRIAIASPGSPEGAAARKVLARLAPAERQAILANVVVTAPDGAGVIAKLAAGAADVGFVFEWESLQAERAGTIIQDVAAPGPPMIAEYAVAVVKASRRQEVANAFVFGLLDANAGGKALGRAGLKAGALPRCGSGSAHDTPCPADQLIMPAEVKP